MRPVVVAAVVPPAKVKPKAYPEWIASASPLYWGEWVKRRPA
jgi:hypothetical protein